MNKTKKRSLLAVCAGMVGFVAFAIVGPGRPRAMTPCLPFVPVTLTGTLIEVRQGDTFVPREQAILEGIPRHLCITGMPDASHIGNVAVSDCDFPEHAVGATVLP